MFCDVDSEIIRSRDNSQLKLARALQNKKARNETGLTVLEGVRLLNDALICGVQPQVLLFSDALRLRPGGQEVLKKATGLSKRVHRVEERLFETLTDTRTSQGVLALVPIPNHTVEAIADRTALRNGFSVMLEDVQDPGNVGTIIRLAAGFGAEGVVLSPNSADPWNPKCLRASMGGAFRIPVVSANSWESAISTCKAYGRLSVAHIEKSAVVSWEAEWPRPQFLVLANEAHGPSEFTVSRADSVVRIPMPGLTESLNVAASAAVLLYEMIRPS